MNQPCRCSNKACEMRVSLSKPPSEYVRPPKCKGCGGRKYYICKDRFPAKWGRKLKCHCSGYHFPHRKGSKWCEKNPRLEIVYMTSTRRAA